MIPTKFEEQTKDLSKLAGMTDEECGSLPVFCDGRQCISLWQLSWKERLQILLYGKIWLSVFSGYTQPPVWLSAEKTVFDTPKEEFKTETA